MFFVTKSKCKIIIITLHLFKSRSPVGLKGKLVHLSKDENGTVVSSDCKINVQTGLPYEGECQFIPNENQDVTTSIMSLQYLDDVRFLKFEILKFYQKFVWTKFKLVFKFIYLKLFWVFVQHF